MRFSKILLPSAIITVTANAATIPQETKCNAQLNAAFEELRANYAETGRLFTTKIPLECKGLSEADEIQSQLMYKTGYKSFCSAQEGDYMRHLSCFAYEGSINGSLAVPFADETASFLFSVLSVTSGSCPSVLTFMPDGTPENTGWNILYEVVTVTGDSCKPSVEPTDLAASLTGSLTAAVRDQKTSFCVLIQAPPDASNNTQIRIRAQYVSETFYDNLYEIPCFGVQPDGFRTEVNKC